LIGEFTYLLIQIPYARCLIADDGLLSMVCCKHGLQRQRSNFDGKFVRFLKAMEQKKLIKKFVNNG